MALAKKTILLFVLLLYGISCSNDKEANCAAALCVANEIIRLEFLSDGSNPLADGTYTSNDISVQGKTLEPLEVTVLTNVQGSTEALLEIRSTDWDSGAYFYTIELGEDWSVPLEVRFTLSKSNDPCCGDRLEILNLVSNTFRVEDQVGFYTVFLE